MRWGERPAQRLADRTERQPRKRQGEQPPDLARQLTVGEAKRPDRGPDEETRAQGSRP